MQKAVTFSLFFFVSMVLLIHVIFPHHHHDEVDVCFVYSHCEESKAFDNQHSNTNHRHDAGGRHLEDCFVKYTYVSIGKKEVTSYR